MKITKIKKNKTNLFLINRLFNINLNIKSL
jgi:hypothetical protein